MFSFPAALSILALVFLLFHAIRFILATLRPAGFPPGPPIIPGLGNIHQLPLKKPFLTFETWANQYGPMLGLKFGPMNVVVLHRAEHVRELFEKRGAYYAARPKMAIGCDYIFTGESDHFIGFMPVEYQRRQLRACKPHLGPLGIAELEPIQRAVAVRLLHNLSLLADDDTTGFRKCIRQWALGVALAMISGQRIENLDKDWVNKYHEVQQGLSELLEAGGATPPIDFFPFLAWLPASVAKWKTRAAAVRRGLYEMYHSMFAHAKQARDHEALDNSGRRHYEPLLTRLLRERDERPGDTEKAESKAERFSDGDIALMGGGILDAASHTTQGTAMYLVQALAAHPEVQRRAQAEIDSYFDSLGSGSSILPEHIDKSKLPYVSACITEVLRWRPVTPQGVPRICVADENVLGYRIPKGSMVMINVWAIHHNPDDYDEPHKFKPERFLSNRIGTKQVPQGGEEGEKSMAWRKPLYTFGAGRRACQGELFALNAIHVIAVLLLRAYDIVPDGEMDLSVETGMLEGAASQPKPFRVRFVARNEKAKEAIRQESMRANQLLEELLS